MTKHSSLPWRLTQDGPDYSIWSADDQLIANDTSYYPSAPEPEDAAFIVKAVNAHDDLVAALKRLDDHWTESFPSGPEAEDLSYGLGKLAESTVSIWKQIRAALAKAEAK